MKVFLRERKRHTARCVASARSTALSPGGYPHPVPTRGGGTPSCPNGGYPPPPVGQMGVPHTPVSWMGVPPPGQPDGDPPSLKCEQTDTCENSTFPIPSEWEHRQTFSSVFHVCLCLLVCE